MSDAVLEALRRPESLVRRDLSEQTAGESDQ
jgi:hypothetical protein